MLHAEGNEDMPVWLISRDDWDDLTVDGDLTKAELEGADSLVKGEAEQFVMHLENPDAQLLRISSNGTLPDGRTFKVRYSRTGGTVNTNEVTVK